MLGSSSFSFSPLSSAFSSKATKASKLRPIVISLLRSTAHGAIFGNGSGREAKLGTSVLWVCGAVKIIRGTNLVYEPLPSGFPQRSYSRGCPPTQSSHALESYHSRWRRVWVAWLSSMARRKTPTTMTSANGLLNSRPQSGIQVRV